MGSVSLSTVVQWVTTWVTVASLLHTLLPPWEAFSDFPNLQKKYKLFVYVLGYMALSARSTIYPNISTGSGQYPSKATANGSGGPDGIAKQVDAAYSAGSVGDPKPEVAVVKKGL